jgi:hypothetical protein
MMLTHRHGDTERAWPRIAAFVILLALVLSRPAGAQDERLVPGAPLRITDTAGEWRRARVGFVALRGDTLLVARKGEPEAMLPLERLAEVQVLARPARRGTSTLLGMAIGGALGYVVYKERLDARHSNDEWNGFVATLIGVPVGALGGGAVGYTLGRERWETVRVR